MLIAELRLAQWFVDIATIFGVLGTIATLVGLWWTWWQVQETKKAAEAARDAILATAAADRLEFTRFVVATCHRLLRETTLYVDNQQYDLGALRAVDLADQLAQIGRSSPELVQGWEDDVQSLRSLEETLKRIAAKKDVLPAASLRKWHAIQKKLYTTIDLVHGPFANHTEDLR